MLYLHFENSLNMSQLIMSVVEFASKWLLAPSQHPGGSVSQGPAYRRIPAMLWDRTVRLPYLLISTLCQQAHQPSLGSSSVLPISACGLWVPCSYQHRPKSATTAGSN